MDVLLIAHEVLPGGWQVGDVRISLGGVWSASWQDHAYTGRQAMHIDVQGGHDAGWSMVAVG